MTSPHYIVCPNCRETRDTSGRYTSPANRELDRKWWQEEHLSGRCVTENADAPADTSTPVPETEPHRSPTVQQAIDRLHRLSLSGPHDYPGGDLRFDLELITDALRDAERLVCAHGAAEGGAN